MGRNLYFQYKKLIKSQNRSARVISNVKYRDNADPLYKALGILKLVDINKYLTGRFMFRYCNGSLPELLNSFFVYNSDYHNYNTRTAQHFHIPPVKTDLAKTGIKYRGAIIWNCILSHGIYSDTSESVFVKFLKLIVDTLPWKHLKTCYSFDNAGMSSLLIICIVFCIHHILAFSDLHSNVLMAALWHYEASWRFMPPTTPIALVSHFISMKCCIETC